MSSLKSQENNNPKYRASLVLFNLVFSFVLVSFIFFVVLFAGCFTASGRVPSPSFQIARIMVYGSSESEVGKTVSARIAILDTGGNEIAVIERSWQGFYLSMEFVKAEILSRRYYFPYLVKGSEKIIEKKRFFRKKKGTCLYPYYIENSRCLLYGTKNENIQKDLYKIANTAKNPFALLFPGFAGRVVFDLSRCENGIFYGIYSDGEGGLVLEKE